MPATLSAQSRILSPEQIRQKITRIAYEIYERNFEASEITLVGIAPNGYRFAQLLEEQLKQIAPFSVRLHRLELDKTAPDNQQPTLSPELTLDHKSVILVDDVLNTGRTLAYSLPLFLASGVNKVEIATLIDRHHPRFPVAATYTGYSLATTLNEHIAVTLPENGEFGAYLV